MEFLCPHCQQRVSVHEIYTAEIRALVVGVTEGETELAWCKDEIRPLGTIAYVCGSCGYREETLSAFPVDGEH